MNKGRSNGEYKVKYHNIPTKFIRSNKFQFSNTLGISQVPDLVLLLDITHVFFELLLNNKVYTDHFRFLLNLFDKAIVAPVAQQEFIFFGDFLLIGLIDQQMWSTKFRNIENARRYNLLSCPIFIFSNNKSSPKYLLGVSRCIYGKYRTN